MSVLSPPTAGTEPLPPSPTAGADQPPSPAGCPSVSGGRGAGSNCAAGRHDDAARWCNSPARLTAAIRSAICCAPPWRGARGGLACCGAEPASAWLGCPPSCSPSGRESGSAAASEAAAMASANKSASTCASASASASASMPPPEAASHRDAPPAAALTMGAPLPVGPDIGPPAGPFLARPVRPLNRCRPADSIACAACKSGVKAGSAPGSGVAESSAHRSTIGESTSRGSSNRSKDETAVT
eukprot:scaffold8425_cov107-Isochrysis_galbana.AAC.2